MDRCKVMESLLRAHALDNMSCVNSRNTRAGWLRDAILFADVDEQVSAYDLSPRIRIGTGISECAMGMRLGIVPDSVLRLAQ